MKRIISLFLAILLLPVVGVRAEDYSMEEDTAELPVMSFDEAAIPASAAELDIPAPCAILIEKETGTVIYEKNADRLCEPASVTKVMTILLIVEAIDSGALTLEDRITVSGYAAGMGGSQVFLEEGESMSLRELLKCIVVSSANDAAVAVAEHMCGTESAFVARMNERAAQLGMDNTCFTNCTGLLESSEHRTTARDIAIMSRELIAHDWIKEYTTIWTDTIRDGTFGLSNTNKLIRFYEGATGLKTGYTSSAGHCLSAAAERDGVEYIAVVLNCASSQERFDSARTLLSFAFSNYALLSVSLPEVLSPIPVTMGKSKFVLPVAETGQRLLVEKAMAGSVENSITLVEGVEAPVKAGQALGTLTVSSGGQVLMEIPIVAGTAVERVTWWDIFRSLLLDIFS